MNSSISTTFAVIVGIIAISLTNAVELPGNFTLPKDSSKLCFIAHFDLTLNVEYLKFDGKTNVSHIPLNNETFHSYDGTCSDTNNHSLTVRMLGGLTTITFDFTLDGKNQTLLRQVSLTVTIANNTYFPNCSDSITGATVFVSNESLFSTDYRNSYRCNSKTAIDNFQSKNNVTIKSIDLETLRVQPFVDPSIPFADFGKESICTMDIFKSSNLIPIIVGIVLALLVVFVLVVYLVRRRNHRHGYQSV